MNIFKKNWSEYKNIILKVLSKSLVLPKVVYFKSLNNSISVNDKHWKNALLLIDETNWGILIFSIDELSWKAFVSIDFNEDGNKTFSTK